MTSGEVTWAATLATNPTVPSPSSRLGMPVRTALWQWSPLSKQSMLRVRCAADAEHSLLWWHLHLMSCFTTGPRCERPTSLNDLAYIRGLWVKLQFYSQWEIIGVAPSTCGVDTSIIDLGNGMHIASADEFVFKSSLWLLTSVFNRDKVFLCQLSELLTLRNFTFKVHPQTGQIVLLYLSNIRHLSVRL